MVITGLQIRAARALLAWSEAELSMVSGIPERTISGIEARERPLDGEVATASRLRSAFESAGLEFVDGGEHGVRLGAAWLLHRIADRAEIDAETRGEARVVRCAQGLRCVGRDGEELGTVRNGPDGIVSDPDVGCPATSGSVTPSFLRLWLHAALARLPRPKRCG